MECNINKSVFITGAASGTGYAIAERFAKEGYDVFIGRRTGANAEKAKCEIPAKYSVTAKRCGMSVFDENNVKRIFTDVSKRGYLLDSLVGINQDAMTVDIGELIDVLHTGLVKVLLDTKLS